MINLEEIFNRTNIIGGLNYATIYDPFQDTWDLVADELVVHQPSGTHPAIQMVGQTTEPTLFPNGRWYPSTTLLPDARVLIVGGYTYFQIGGATFGENRSIEIYDPALKEFSLLVSHLNSDSAVMNQNYPHPVVLPTPIVDGEDSYDVLLFGEEGAPVFLSTSEQHTLDVSSAVRNGSSAALDQNRTATSVLLPLRLVEEHYSNGSMMVAGGTNAAAASMVDVYDPYVDDWIYSMPLRPGGTDPDLAPRNCASVLLPDGRVATAVRR